MKAEIKYKITHENGKVDEFEDKDKAVNIFQMIYDKLREANRDHLDSNNPEWWPSLHIDMFLAPCGVTDVHGTITIQFNCEENGKDVHKFFQHELSTEIIPYV